MIFNRRNILISSGGLLAFLAGCSGGGGGGSSSGGGSSPSSKFDLKKYRIQLPVNENGDLSGSMHYINPAKTVKPWFIHSADKLEFTCPVKGATSGGSNSPRTELRENYEWKLEEGGWMEARLAVTAIPSGQVCVGQVWNEDQALRLYVTSGGLIQSASEYQTRKTVGNIPLGQYFTYRVEVKDKVLTLFINGTQVQQYSVHQWAGKRMYLKAGTYCSALSGTDPKAEFKATFTDLKIGH